VKRGQVVATLDQAIFLSQIQQAEAQVFRLRAEHERARVQVLDAETKLKRARRLDEQQLTPATDLETAEVNTELAKASFKAAEAQLTQAEGALAQTKVNLSYTVIRSPVDGIILNRNVDVGQTVAAGLQAPTLFVIARSLDTLELAASVAESDVGRVRPGQPVSFTVDAYPREAFSGTVRQVRLQPTVQQNVVSYTTIIDVPNPGGRLKPGMTATLAIEVARAENVLKVPASALRFQPSDAVLAAYGGSAEAVDGSGTAGAAGQRPGARPAAGATSDAAQWATVWQLANGALQQVRVRTGISDGTTMAILEGALVEGAQVVTNTTTASTATPTTTNSSPLVPTMPRRPGGGTQRR
jgi:HlyD family secretion protein